MPEVDDAARGDRYAESYSQFGIHEEMLKDEVRTRTSMHAIHKNRHLFKDKVVLDVGCGTGILSMFAVQAGASHVIAVDMSNIMNMTKQIIERNGFADRITLIYGKIEEVDLPVEKVDIILSEWMGYFLFYESMLNTVLFARDKWLQENGLLFPDKATLYIAAIEDADYKREKIDYWNDVYGFDMSCIREVAMLEPLVDNVDPRAMVTPGVPVYTVDLTICTKEDLTFEANFQLKASRNDYVHAFVGYFDVGFTLGHTIIGFSTSPMSRYTHWKQTVFYLNSELTICKGEAIEFQLRCKPNNQNPRDLDISFSYEFDGIGGSVKDSQCYCLR